MYGEAGPEADAYSLGVTLLELWTGQCVDTQEGSEQGSESDPGQDPGTPQFSEFQWLVCSPIRDQEARGAARERLGELVEELHLGEPAVGALVEQCLREHDFQRMLPGELLAELRALGRAHTEGWGASMEMSPVRA